jgi:hypothetical protein
MQLAPYEGERLKDTLEETTELLNLAKARVCQSELCWFRK